MASAVFRTTLVVFRAHMDSENSRFLYPWYLVPVGSLGMDPSWIQMHHLYCNRQGIATLILNLPIVHLILDIYQRFTFV